MLARSVVVITYNSGHVIRSCLQEILKNPSWQIVVVDNASTDATQHVVREFAGERVTFVGNQINAGFASAANQGERLTLDGIIVLLNPDVLAATNAFDTLASALADEAIGAAAGMLLDANGRPQRGFQFRRFPTLGPMLAEVLLLNSVWRGNPWNRRYRCLDDDDSKPQFVDQPAGACLAVRREAWESIGGFDESFYPVWFEDVDFCRRLVDRGWKIAYCPDARFTHVGGHSVSKLPFRDKQAFWYANMLRYFSKHHGRVKTAVLRVGILAGLVLRAFASLVGGGPRKVSTKEALAGYGHAARVVLRPSRSQDASKRSPVGVAAV